jgi:hypothetical protein
MTPSLRRALMALPLLTLAGCYGNPVTRYYEWRKHDELVQFAPEPLYCYRTLAQSDCYAQPLDRRDTNRMVGYYGPPPGRVLTVAPPAPQEKIGNVIDHPPLMVPREQVESAPLQLVPPPQPKPPAESGG